MYTYQHEVENVGLESLSKKGKTGAALIEVAINRIKKKCDSLNFVCPKPVISQLHSAAGGLGTYSTYLHHMGNYATKNIYSQNLHMELWKMYSAIWCLRGFR